MGWTGLEQCSPFFIDCKLPRKSTSALRGVRPLDAPPVGSANAPEMGEGRKLFLPDGPVDRPYANLGRAMLSFHCPKPRASRCDAGGYRGPALRRVRPLDAPPVGSANAPEMSERRRFFLPDGPVDRPYANPGRAMLSFHCPKPRASRCDAGGYRGPALRRVRPLDAPPVGSANAPEMSERRRFFLPDGPVDRPYANPGRAMLSFHCPKPRASRCDAGGYRGPALRRVRPLDAPPVGSANAPEMSERRRFFLPDGPVDRPCTNADVPRFPFFNPNDTLPDVAPPRAYGPGRKKVCFFVAENRKLWYHKIVYGPVGL